ncbi:MAG: GH3 auxin-responsive promoter family protein, partial [Bacteroidota bacterium]|nr:GH3 auxin-responsive promoter family protein [Bacteroidota bacterium]
MSIKSFLAKIFAKYIVSKTRKWSANPVATQKAVFQHLIKNGAQTRFGQDHDFRHIDSFEAFAKKVPVRDYEALKSYVEEAVAGKPDILWPGKPEYFAKTSGTTSGAKYIPITK